MPGPFSIIIGAVIGYLNGAGLGALLIDFLSNHTDSEPRIMFIALIVTGPLGALLGLLVAWLPQKGEETAATLTEAERKPSALSRRFKK